MARKAKERTVDLYYLNSNEDNEKKKARAKHINSPSKNKKKKKNVEEDSNSDIFNFDNEIVIGVNVLPNQKGNNKNKKNMGNIEKLKNINGNKSKNIVKQKNIPVDNKEVDKHVRNYKKARIIIKVFLIILLFTAVAIFLITSPIFNITKINISGNEKISKEQIISLSQIQLDTNIYKMLSSRVEENIKENAYIETVIVKRKIPNEVNITVVERKPQYMLKYGNAYVYLNSRGYMLEISDEKLGLPIISGYSTKAEDINPGNRLNSEDLKKLEVILRVMDSATNNDIAQYISEINISDDNNYTLILEEKEKIAYLGEETNISDKMAVLKQMIIKAEGQSGKAFLMDKDKMYFREE